MESASHQIFLFSWPHTAVEVGNEGETKKKRIKLFNWVEMKIIYGDLLKTNDNRMVRRRDIPEELRGG